MVSPDEILLHPTRLRIVLSMAGQAKTTHAIQEELDDVPHATLYRHINRLIEGGVIEVVSERQVRGGVERLLGLVEGAASFGPEDFADASRDELLGYFVRVVAGLIGDFARYLEQGEPDLASDGVGFRQVPVWLTDREFTTFSRDLRKTLESAHENEPTSKRRRRLVTTVVMPVE